MSPRTSIRRRVTLGSFTAAAALTLAAGALAAATGAQAATRAAPVTNPYSPAYHHSYRHGVIPTIAVEGKMRQWAQTHQNVSALSANDLNYGGGIDGIGVTTGHEKVYLVFYGSQWGTQGTDSNGDVTLSGDPSGEAPYYQQFIKGLGTGGELWSGVMTQYCDGVSVGAIKCPKTAKHVGYPTGGALAGVWEDSASASPKQSSASQLAQEAVKAAGHFGNKTGASNRLTQYVIISPTGTNPDNYKGGGFCAWHDFTGSYGLSGPGTPLAFTNLPYIPDAKANCGAGVVNPGNALDGVTIVEGHEYAETITDQFPAGGWLANNGEETGDVCAWVTSGPGRMQDIHLSTGSFAVQGTWSNLANKGNGGCSVSHSIVT